MRLGSLLARAVAPVAVVAVITAGCAEEAAGPVSFTAPTQELPTDQPATEAPTATDGGDADGDPAGSQEELCALFREVEDLDETMRREVNQVMAPLFTLDPGSDDLDAEAERILGELQAVVRSLDVERIREIYTRLAELVPEELRQDAIALRDGTLALIDILLELDAGDLDDFDAQLATPEVLAAGVATLALDELSRAECDIAIAN